MLKRKIIQSTTILGKISIILSLLVIGVMFIGHITLKYSNELLTFSDFMRNYWWLWIVIRFGIYSVIGVFLYKLIQLLHLKLEQGKISEQDYQLDRLQYKKLARAFVIFVVALEVINLIRIA